MDITLPIDDTYSLTEVRYEDAPILQNWLKEPEIAQNTMTVPFPYTQEHAYDWLHGTRKKCEAAGHITDVAVRAQNGMAFGYLGFHHIKPNIPTLKEVGYWLARPLWGRGIMTRALKVFCAYGFERLALQRIEANTFLSNERSGRVLEKAGFKLECVRHAYYLKNGRILDGKMYALLKPKETA